MKKENAPVSFMVGVLFAISVKSSFALGSEPAPKSSLFPTLGVSDLALKVSPGTRRCCLLGTNLEMLGLFATSQTIDPSQLGDHNFGGAKDEGNGMIATCSAGFLDIAHIRYAADLTLKLALQIEALGPKGGTLKLHPEAGKGSLQINPWSEKKVPDSGAQERILSLAGSIALDLTAWHEIITWYNFSEVPLYTEKGSSFSPEDAFSNQLGIELGKRAIRKSILKGIPYDRALTEELQSTLANFGALAESETIRILDDLEQKQEPDFLELIDSSLSPSCSSVSYTPWFDPKYNIPNFRRLVTRNTKMYGEIEPTLPPASLLPKKCLGPDGEYLSVAKVHQPSLWDQYTLQFQLKRSDSAARKVSRQSGRTITQNDFPKLIESIEREIPLALPPL